MVLVSTVTQFLLIALVVLAVLLGSTVGYFFFRARRSEAGALTDDERAELRKRDQELANIRNRLDEISWRQQTGAETQQQVVNQQLEQMQHQLTARGRQIEGLHGQLKYEMAQRQEEMDELRRQLHEVVHVMREGAQLPAASRAQLPPAPEPASRDHVEPAEAPQPEATPAAAEQTAAPAGEPPVQPAAEPPVQPAAEPPAYEPPAIEWMPAHEIAEEAAPEDDFSWEPIELDFALEPVEDAPVASGDTEEEEREDLLSLFTEATRARHPRTEEPAETEAAPPSFEPIEAFMEESAQAPPQNDLDQEEEDPFAGVVQWTTIETPKQSAPPAGGSHTHEPESTHPPAGASPFADLPSFEPAPRTPPPFEPAQSAPPPFEPDFAAFEAQFSSGDGIGSDYPAEPEEPQPSGEDLTALPMITPERQRVLHTLGIHSVEEIARFSRADARRVADAIRDVNEDVVMNDWVFAAQSVLFDRYQDELRTRRTRSF
jgi:predicted flap endonuclease-1-like 5' DNA nuclease/TolA-binding protein